MRIDEFGKALTPIRRDIEVVKKGKFLFGFHELTTEDTEEYKQIEAELMFRIVKRS